MTDLTPTDWRALCAELVDALDKCQRPYGDQPESFLAWRTRAALAQPEPQGPTDEELKAAYWEVFKNAAPCGAEESWLAGLRAVARWGRPAIEPDGPAVPDGREPASVTDQSTDEELDEFAIYWWGTEIDERSVSDVIESGSMAAFACAALARWGRPAIEPQGLPPRVGHILRLAEIIREVDGNHDKSATALAEAILSHPDCSYDSPAIELVPQEEGE